MSIWDELDQKFMAIRKRLDSVEERLDKITPKDHQITNESDPFNEYSHLCQCQRCNKEILVSNRDIIRYL